MEWRRLHNEEIYDLYCSPNTILVIKSGRIRWADVCTYGGEVHTRVWWEELREGDHLKDSGVDSRIKLKCIFKKWGEVGGGGGVDWIELNWIWIGTGGRLL